MTYEFVKHVADNLRFGSYDGKWEVGSSSIKIKDFNSNTYIKLSTDEIVVKNEEGDVEKKEDNLKIKRITNIFLKLKELDATYKDNLKNNKIDYKRVIKENDTIYYSLKSEILGDIILKGMEFLT